MPRNGSGTFTVYTPGNPVVTGAVISSTAFNATMTDFATGLTNSIAKDGQTTPTANLPMGSYKHTGVGAGSALTDYARYDQLQNSSPQWLTSVSGTDTITASATVAPSAYAAGQTFRFVAAGSNSGAVTLNVNSLGAKSVTKNGTKALAAGDITSGSVVCVQYDGTQFQLGQVGSLWGGVAADIASAATLDLTAAQGIVRITGTTTTTDITINAGQRVECVAVGAWPLTYHATQVPLPGGASYTCAAGDVVVVSKDNNGTKHIAITRANGQAVIGSSSVLTTSYDSGEQTITAGGSLTLAHGLGAIPKVVQCLIKCTSGELGYSVGDYAYIWPMGSGDGGSSSSSRGVSIVPDATNLNVRFGSAAASIQIVDKSTGGTSGLTNANWKIIFRAYY